MTSSELLDYIKTFFRGQESKLPSDPLILAMANLCLEELVITILNTNPELAKKFGKTLTNQTWSFSRFNAPNDMLFTNQFDTTRIDFNGNLAYQIRDRKFLDMVGTLGNHFYALEGKTFFINHSSGDTSGNTLNIFYYRIPDLDDIDEELRGIFLKLVLQKILNFIGDNSDGKQK